MNKVYKVIWSSTLDAWVAVSETSKRGKKTKTKKVGLALAVSLMMSSSSIIFAGYEAGGGSTFQNCDISALGNGTESSGIAIGNEVAVNATNNAQACAPTLNSIAIGSGATTKASAQPATPYNQSIAIGNFAKATGDQAVALGANVSANGNSSIAIGGDDIDRLANDTTINSNYQKLTGVKLVAGNAAGGSYRATSSSGAGSVAVGTQSMASGNFSSALGMTASATGDASVALGVFANASAGAALAIGPISKALAEQSIALGTNAEVKATATNSIAIGNGAIASNANSIALGSSSKANSTTLKNAAYLVGGEATSEVNIGNRRITGVSAGSDDTDAVNVSQLKKASQIAKTEVLAGKNIQVTPSVGDDGQAIYTVATAADLNVTSVTAGDKAAGNAYSEFTTAGLTVTNAAGNSSTVGAEQLTVGGANSIQVDGALGQITGLNNTTLGGDTFAQAGRAATEEQLNQSTSDIANLIGGEVSNSNGAITGPFNVNGTDYNTIAEAIGDEAKAAKTEVLAGKNIQVTPSVGDDGQAIYTVATAADLNVTSVTAGDKAAGNAYSEFTTAGLTVTNAAGNSSTVGAEQLTVGGANSIQVDGALGQITGLNNTTLGGDTFAQAGRAATEEQLNQSTSDIANLIGGEVSNSNGAITGPFNVNGTDYNTIAEAIGDEAKAAKTEVLAGKNIQVTPSVGDDGQAIYTVATAADLNVTSVTAGDKAAGNAYSEFTTAGLTVTNAAGNSSTVGAEQLTVGGANSIQVDGALGQITGLSNTTLGGDTFAKQKRAATEEQLNATQQNLTTILGVSASNINGQVSAVDIGGTGQNNIHDAISSVKNAADQANQGWSISTDTGVASSVKSGDTVDFTNTDGNVQISNQANNVTVNLNKHLNLESITAGKNVLSATGLALGTSVVVNDTGLMIANGPSMTAIGINAGAKVISNVADGKLASDAVNKGQLTTAIQNMNQNVTALSDSAVKYDKNVDGSINKDSITLAGGINGTQITNVANGKVESGSKDAVNGGQLATVKNDLQGQITANATDINNIKNDINTGTVGLVKQENPTADITVAKDTGGSKVNVSGTAGDRVVTGVSKGNIHQTSLDAVNGSQLNTSNQYIASSLGGGAGYDNITQSFNAPTYKVGTDTYNNVGDAVTALNSADTALGNRINNLGDQLQQAFYGTNERIDSVERKANAGIAAAMALESAPYIPGKYTYAAGASYHGGENAVGVTLRKTADNGRWSLTGGVAAASQGDPSVRIGISGVIN